MPPPCSSGHAAQEEAELRIACGRKFKGAGRVVQVLPRQGQVGRATQEELQRGPTAGARPSGRGGDTSLTAERGHQPRASGGTAGRGGRQGQGWQFLRRIRLCSDGGGGQGARTPEDTHRLVHGRTARAIAEGYRGVAGGERDWHIYRGARRPVQDLRGSVHSLTSRSRSRRSSRRSGWRRRLRRTRPRGGSSVSHPGLWRSYKAKAVTRPSSSKTRCTLSPTATSSPPWTASLNLGISRLPWRSPSRAGPGFSMWWCSRPKRRAWRRWARWWQVQRQAWRRRRRWRRCPHVGGMGAEGCSDDVSDRDFDHRWRCPLVGWSRGLKSTARECLRLPRPFLVKPVWGAVVWLEKRRVRNATPGRFDIGPRCGMNATGGGLGYNRQVALI